MNIVYCRYLCMNPYIRVSETVSMYHGFMVECLLGKQEVGGHGGSNPRLADHSCYSFHDLRFCKSMCVKKKSSKIKILFLRFHSPG